VQERAATAIHGTRVLSIERDEVFGFESLVEIRLNQAEPATSDTNDLKVVGLGAAVDHGLHDGVEAGNIAAARQDSDPLLCHDALLAKSETTRKHPKQPAFDSTRLWNTVAVQVESPETTRVRLDRGLYCKVEFSEKASRALLLFHGDAEKSNVLFLELIDMSC